MRDWESAEVTFLQYAFVFCITCSAIASTIETTLIRIVPFCAELRCWIASTRSIFDVQLHKITSLIMLNWNDQFKESAKELGYGIAPNI